MGSRGPQLWISGVGIERLHLEQDAGKSLHDRHSTMSLVDLNRAGVALMEMGPRQQIYNPLGLCSSLYCLQISPHHTDLSTTFTRRYVVEVPAQLSDEEWEKKYSLPAPNSVQ